MDLEELEVQSRIILEEMLNHLQTTNLLVTQAAEQVERAGQSARSLGQLIEEFIAQQRSQDT